MQYSPPRFLLSLGVVALFAAGCNVSVPEGLNDQRLNVTPPAITDPTKANPSTQPTTPTTDTTPVVSKAEEESCTPKKEGAEYGRADCREGLVCAPDPYDVTTGSCRTSCSNLVSGKTVKAPEKCASNRTCQATTSLSFDELGNYCLPQQTKRDGLCKAITDDQACSNNRICAVSDLSKDENGQPVATSFVCRDACEYGTLTANEGCSNGEQCTAYPYDSTQQLVDGKPVLCTETKCKGDMADCECDHANGFQCSALIPGVIAFCERKAGICTTPVPFSSASDFGEEGFSGAKCNEVKGHAFCDNSLFKGVENPGEAMCVQISESSGDGFCFAFCSAPALDLDADGKLEGKDAGQKFGCPVNYTCNTHMGRDLGLVVPMPDRANPSQKKVCDPTKCTAGKPCPEQCGIGDAECLSYEGRSGTMSFCGAPFGNCELSATPVSPSGT